MTRGPSILRKAHGTAAAGGAVLVAEAPPLDEIEPPNPGHTERGLQQRAARGRPFQKGNAAARDRSPSLCRFTSAAVPDEERRRVLRRAESLRRRFVRELSVQVGGTRLTTDVLTECKAWARCEAYADHYDATGERAKAMAASERASAHHLRARGLAERGLQRPAPKTPEQAQAEMRRHLLGDE